MYIIIGFEMAFVYIFNKLLKYETRTDNSMLLSKILFIVNKFYIEIYVVYIFLQYQSIRITFVPYFDFVDHFFKLVQKVKKNDFNLDLLILSYYFGNFALQI